MNRERHAIHQVAVVGLGRFGLTLASTLFDQGYEVLGVDSHEELVQRARDLVTHAVQATLHDMSVVQELGLGEVDAAVVAIGSEEEMNASTVSTALLVEAGVPYVVARAQSKLHGTILERVGAHRVVYPEVLSGQMLAFSLHAPEILEHITLGADAGISTVRAPATWIGKTLAELRLPDRSVGTVVAIQRGQQAIVLPSAEERITDGDVVALLMRWSKLGALEHLLREPA